MEQDDAEIAEAEHNSAEDNSVQRRPVNEKRNYFKYVDVVEALCSDLELVFSFLRK